MEYTALLAGEPFTDHPRCVDGELAAILRAANDMLSNADRRLLVPLLGRAIGLTVEPPPPGPTGYRRAAVRRRRELTAPYRERTARLRREATSRFLTAVEPSSSPDTRASLERTGELSWVFWETLTEPASLSTSPEYVRRLIHRLHVLHDCYEQAMDDLGIPRRGSTGRSPAREAAPHPIPAR
ncbi:hypothetical protein [Geodermatophilus sabuli]|nr:hypothetical protein [Geodermatophilus sabuli]MBB3084469.1 hypothetical protein [Geodermatophilus sabuli]